MKLEKKRVSESLTLKKRRKKRRNEKRMREVKRDLEREKERQSCREKYFQKRTVEFKSKNKKEKVCKKKIERKD